MRCIIGDLWAGEADWRTITTNRTVWRDRRAVMGCGAARQAADKYPRVPFVYGADLRRGIRGLDPIIIEPSPGYGILCFPVLGRVRPKTGYANVRIMPMVPKEPLRLAVLGPKRAA